MNIISTNHFTLRRTRGRFFVRGKTDDIPRGRRISDKDARYLQGLNHTKRDANRITEFDMACVWDMGVSVFANSK